MKSLFLSLMPSTVHVYSAASKSQYGTATYSTSGTAYRCRIARRRTQMRDSNGNTVVAQHTLWIDSTGTISTNDRIVLPDGTSPPVVAVESYPDENGTHHYRVTLG